MEDRSKLCYFVGYAPNGYRMYSKDEKKIIISRDVVFVGNTTAESPEETKNAEDAELANQTKENTREELNVALTGIKRIVKENNHDEDKTEGETSGVCEPAEEMMEKIPKNYNEAMVDNNAENWRKAMQEEYYSLMENKTWVLAELPEGKKPIKCKWVFAIKKNPEGKVLRYKARLVAKGYSQVEGIDYQKLLHQW